MASLLVPVDGSESSNRAVQAAISMFAGTPSMKLHLLNVQPPIMSGEVRLFVSREMIDNYHEEEGELALRPAKALLDEAGVTYTTEILVGHVAETIARCAKDRHCDQIVMGTRGLGAVAGLLLGSIATKVLHLVDVPVTLVK
jgi:nucleotide-binding universal stress UspA family protein